MGSSPGRSLDPPNRNYRRFQNLITADPTESHSMSLKLIVAAVSLMFPAISVFESTSFITPAAKIHSHGLTTDRNHVDNMDVSVAGADANGIYDFKAGFGASGSQQTMTCTANATQ